MQRGPVTDLANLFQGPLVRPLVRWTVTVFAVTLSLILFAAGVRLLPWVVDGHVGWGPLLVFARGLIVVGLETSWLVALPLGGALAIASLQDRGEARACLLAGASPGSLVRDALPVAVVLAGIILAPSFFWGKDATAAGSIARGLLATARAECDPVRRPVSNVPLMGASWLCAPGVPPRFLLTAKTSLALWAEAVTPRDDLRGASAEAVSLDVRGPPVVHVHVNHAELTGLPPFARADQARWLRPFVVAFGAWAGAGATMLVLLYGRDGARWKALLVGGAASGLGLAALTSVERAGTRGAGFTWYLLVPLLMTLPAWILRVTEKTFATRRAQRALQLLVGGGKA